MGGTINHHKPSNLTMAQIFLSLFLWLWIDRFTQKAHYKTVIPAEFCEWINQVDDSSRVCPPDHLVLRMWDTRIPQNDHRKCWKIMKNIDKTNRIPVLPTFLVKPMLISLSEQPQVLHWGVKYHWMRRDICFSTGSTHYVQYLFLRVKKGWNGKRPSPQPPEWCVYSCM